MQHSHYPNAETVTEDELSWEMADVLQTPELARLHAQGWNDMADKVSQEKEATKGLFPVLPPSALQKHKLRHLGERGLGFLKVKQFTIQWYFIKWNNVYSGK